MLKRNQSQLDQCLSELVKEQNLSSIPELLNQTTSTSIPSIEIPRYVRINLLKTKRKTLRLNLKELSFKKLKNM